MAMGRVGTGKGRWLEPRSRLGRWLVGEARTGGTATAMGMGMGEPGKEGRWLSGDDRAGGCSGRRRWAGTAFT
jgi:hypothetical protein